MPATARKRSHAPTSSAAVNLRDYIMDIPDFPRQGIIFRDISPLLRLHFAETIREMALLFSSSEWQDIDFIAGIESRGFILAAALAVLQGKGFVKIRKRGKLPGEVVSRAYKLEYGEDALEMHHGKGRILIVDDVLATGGTLRTAADLAHESGHEVKGLVCLLSLSYLNADFAWKGFIPRALVRYLS